MRAVLFGGLAGALMVMLGEGFSIAAQVPREKAKEVPKEVVKSGETNSAAEFTRTKLLKVRVTGSYQDMRLGEVLKDLGDQVDMQGDQPVMWAYGMGFPFAQKVTFACKDKPLDVVLDQLLSKAGGGLGYVVTSKEGDKYDGWVRLTTKGERGFEKGVDPPASAEDEASAAEKLALAKKLISAGKPASAKPLLEILAKKYANTRAGAEAKEILTRLGDG